MAWPANPPTREASAGVKRNTLSAVTLAKAEAGHLERDSSFLNRWGIPKGLRVRFSVLAGMEASMDGQTLFGGFAFAGCWTR